MNAFPQSSGPVAQSLGVSPCDAPPADLPGDAAGSVLFVTTCWFPWFARLAHLFQLADFQVAVLSPHGHPMLALPDVRVFAQQPFRPLAALSDAIAKTRPSYIVPGDDRAVAHLHRLYRDGTDEERAMIARSLGDPANYSVASSRLEVSAVARRVGFLVPGDAEIRSSADLDRWASTNPFPWILKMNDSWSGVGVRVVHSRAAAEAAFRELACGVKLGTALKRALIDRDTFWLGDRLSPTRQVVSVQQFIRGRPGNLAMFCWQGRVIAASVVEVVACWREVGSSTIVRIVDRPEFVESARALADALGLEGFFGLDFMVDEATGEAAMIEMNTRATALCNIRIDQQRDLIAAAASAWGGRAIDPPAPLGTEFVAHFPLTWQGEPGYQRLHDCYQDIPWQEPKLLTAMLEPAWADRSWQARCLARLRSWLGHSDRMFTIDPDLINRDMAAEALEGPPRATPDPRAQLPRETIRAAIR